MTVQQLAQQNFECSSAAAVAAVDDFVSEAISGMELCEEVIDSAVPIEQYAPPPTTDRDQVELEIAMEDENEVDEQRPEIRTDVEVNVCVSRQSDEPGKDEKAGDVAPTPRFNEQNPDLYFDREDKIPDLLQIPMFGFGHGAASGDVEKNSSGNSSVNTSDEVGGEDNSSEDCVNDVNAADDAIPINELGLVSFS